MLKTLRGSDVLVLLAISSGVAALAPALGVTDPRAAVVMSMGWTCPAARRLIEWRRGRQEQRRVTLENPAASARLLCFGVLPWVILPLVHSVQPSMLATTAPLPGWLQVAGALLALGGVLRPLSLLGGHRIRSNSGVEAVGLFLLTGSPFLGVLAAGAMLMGIAPGRSWQRAFAVPQGL